ncbi:AAA family ATPase [Streptomyces sp. NPDC007984]|uniref:ATP-binding protein n=1 Tax=Streptomyces sp. NPDC007984 TaxID=3364801 RepID=UPI0036E334C3
MTNTAPLPHDSRDTTGSGGCEPAVGARNPADGDDVWLSLSALLCGAAPPVGRTMEAGRLAEEISLASLGAGGTVLVRGPAGIGKSCLLRRALDAVSRDWRVLRVTGDVLDGARALPFSAIGTLSAGEHGPRSAHVEELVAAVALAAQEQDHQAVGLCVTRLFRQLRQEAPTVLVLDDLTHIDGDTLALAGRLARAQGRFPLVVTATSRCPDPAPVGPLGAFLERSETEGSLHVVDLAPLDAEDTARLVATALGLPPSTRLAAHVQGRSAGHPFFVLQTLLDLLENRRLRRDASHWHLVGEPSALSRDRRRQILQRALGEAPETLRVARAAALLRVIPLAHLDLLALISRLPPQDTEAVFDGLVRLGVLCAASSDRYRFTHELVREALYEDMGPAARRQAHRTAATWLLNRPPSPERDEDIAGHVARTADYGDLQAIDTLAAEARRAFSRAPAASVPWYRKALAVTPPAHPRYAELVTRLTLSLLVAGRPAEAARVGTQASRGAVGADRRSARLSSLVVGALAEHGALGEALELAGEAGAASPGDLLLTSQSAHLHLMTGRPREATAAADDARALLERAPVGDQITALGYLSSVHCLSAGYSGLAAFAARLRQAAAEAPRGARLHALSSMSLLYSMQGDTRACADALAEADSLLADCGWHLFGGSLLVARVHNAVHRGDWAAAHTEIGTATRQMRESGLLGHLGLLRMSEAALHAHQGNWRSARQAAEAIGRTQPLSVVATEAAHALTDLVQGEVDRARRRLALLLAERTLPGHLRARLLVRLAEVEAEAGSPKAVTALLAEAREHGMDVHDHLGFTEACLARGRCTGDPEALLEAASLAERHDLAFQRGKAYLYAGSAGIGAEHHLRAAVEVFHRLGALPWRRKAGVELRRRNLKVPRPRTSSPAELTATETQVTRFVQLGQSNREIAQAMSLSVKTVERHLSRVYAKTDCRSRLQLVRALDRGLLGGEAPAVAGDP